MKKLLIIFLLTLLTLISFVFYNISQSNLKTFELNGYTYSYNPADQEVWIDKIVLPDGSERLPGSKVFIETDDFLIHFELIDIPKANNDAYTYDFEDRKLYEKVKNNTFQVKDKTYFYDCSEIVYESRDVYTCQTYTLKDKDTAAFRIGEVNVFGFKFSSLNFIINKGGDKTKVFEVINKVLDLKSV